MKRQALVTALLTLWTATASAQTVDNDDETAPENVTEGFVLPPSTELTPPLVFAGYIDVGFANAEGNGTSYPAGDTRLPADYGVDPFATAVNTRGDVASTDAGGLFTNGFLPRSVEIGGRPSFLVNALNLDLRYQSSTAPVMAFARVQVLPRFGGTGRGNETSVYLEQAFGRVSPFKGRELTISLGKFDSVFGIEYLDTASTFRTGITPSLLARYTTGTSTGAKAFFRQQIARLWSALSLNVSATNSGAFVEALQPPDASLTGRPVLSARLGYELNLPRVQLKLGGSGLTGPRNDQRDRDAEQRMWGADARLLLFGLALAGEYVHVDEDEGAAPKETGLGAFPVSSEFHARGFWTQASYGLDLGWRTLRLITPFIRYEQRRAWFAGFRELTVARLTTGLRLDLWESLILKGEVLFNDEREGAPHVDNDVLVLSAVYAW
jgi:hypothetical protein